MKASEIIEKIAQANKREILRYNSLFKNTVDNWGIVTCSEELITGITGTESGSVTLDLSGWGFTSVDDYEIFTTVKNNYSAISARTWVEKLSATSASIGAITGQGDAVGVYYVIVAKGFGGGSGGSGDGGTVDQTYDATSTNAQSGTAVAEALTPIESAIGDLTTLETTAQDSLVSAVNELKFGLDGLGEPFRVKEWGNDALTNITIPSCNQEIANTAIDKLMFEITGQEATDYQVVGMIAYQITDASGNRLNVWPVCQFTGQNQTQLHVRFMCAGTTNKTPKRISAWVLLKHR